MDIIQKMTLRWKKYKSNREICFEIFVDMYFLWRIPLIACI
jgi:hypothetical protein